MSKIIPKLMKRNPKANCRGPTLQSVKSAFWLREKYINKEVRNEIYSQSIAAI